VAEDQLVKVRLKQDHDGAEPSANSVSALNLLRLSRMLTEEQYANRAKAIFSIFSAASQNAPATVPQMLAALQFSRSEPRQAVIAGDPEQQAARMLVHSILRDFHPDLVALCQGCQYAFRRHCTSPRRHATHPGKLYLPRACHFAGGRAPAARSHSGEEFGLKSSILSPAAKARPIFCLFCAVGSRYIEAHIPSLYSSGFSGLLRLARLRRVRGLTFANYSP
jgi:hypothetical protein